MRPPGWVVAYNLVVLFATLRECAGRAHQGRGEASRGGARNRVATCSCSERFSSSVSAVSTQSGGRGGQGGGHGGLMAEGGGREPPSYRQHRCTSALASTPGQQHAPPPAPPHHRWPAPQSPTQRRRGPPGCRRRRAWRPRHRPGARTRGRAAPPPGQSLQRRRDKRRQKSGQKSFLTKMNPQPQRGQLDGRGAVLLLLSRTVRWAVLHSVLTTASGCLVLCHRDKEGRAVSQLKHRLDLALAVGGLCGPGSERERLAPGCRPGLSVDPHSLDS